MLALLAITQNYGDLNTLSVASNTETFSNKFYMPLANQLTEDDEPKDSPKHSLVGRAAPLSSRSSFKKRSGTNFRRTMF